MCIRDRALLRAHAAADSRQGGCFRQYLICRRNIPLLHLCDKSGYIDMYGAALHALGIFTFETALRFLHGLFQIIAVADLFKISRTNLWILFSDRHLSLIHI